MADLHWHWIVTALEMDRQLTRKGLAMDWHRTGDGLALDCPWIDGVATPDIGSKMMPS